VTNPKTSNDTSSILENKGKDDAMDIVAGLFLVLLAVVTLIWIIPSHTETTSSDYDVSAAFFPYLAVWTTFGLSILLIISRLLKFHRLQGNFINRRILIEVVCWSGISIITFGGITFIGFTWTMPLLIASAMIFSGNRTWWLIGLLSITFPILVNQLIWLIFTVDLP
jgi:hypothetical protein|tara:strand:- start:1506 stop:2006 length:501 start_codon:yes stop_codon:yes gene_type:complete